MAGLLNALRPLRCRFLMRSILRCWRLMSPSLRGTWLWLIPLGVIAAALDVATGVMLLRAAGGFTGGTDWTFGMGPGPTLGVLAFLVLTKTAVRLYETSRRESCSEATVAEFAERLLRFWMGSSLRRQLDSTPTQRVDDVQALATEVGREGINSMVLFWSEGLVVAGLLGLLFVSAPVRALAVLALCGGGAVLTLRISHKRHGRGVAALAPARIRVQGMVQDCIKSSREIRLHGRIGFFAKSYLERRAVFGKIWTELECWKSVPLLANEALFLFGMVGLLAFSADRGPAAGSAAPLLMLFLYAGLRMLPAMNRLVYRGLALRSARHAADRVSALLSERETNSPKAWEASAPLPGSGTLQAFRSPTAIGPAHQMHIADAWFTYPDRSIAALAGISLDVRAGEKLALVGPSGGGKSTVLLLLAALLAPDRGAVEADGAPLVVDDPVWHRQLGFVAQDALILEDTVQANIALGLEPGAIDEEALTAAVTLAQLDPGHRRLAGRHRYAPGERRAGIIRRSAPKNRVGARALPAAFAAALRRSDRLRGSAGRTADLCGIGARAPGSNGGLRDAPVGDLGCG